MQQAKRPCFFDQGSQRFISVKKHKFFLFALTQNVKILSSSDQKIQRFPLVEKFICLYACIDATSEKSLFFQKKVVSHSFW